MIYDRHQPARWGALFDAYYIIRRALLLAMRDAAPATTGLLLDFGCGRMPYRNLFSRAMYIGADVLVSGHPLAGKCANVFFDGRRLPFRDGSFNAVLATEVIEHVPDLRKTLVELRRVLVPGGRLILTMPFTWPEHEMPYDFRRLTSVGLRECLTEARFDIVGYRKLGVGWRAIGQLANAYMMERSLRWAPRVLRRLLLILPVALINILACLLGREGEQGAYYLGHYVVATRA